MKLWRLFQPKMKSPNLPPNLNRLIWRGADERKSGKKNWEKWGEKKCRQIRGQKTYKEKSATKRTKEEAQEIASLADNNGGFSSLAVNQFNKSKR